MSTIFISHSSKDNTIAKELERRLAERNHHSVFLDLDPEKGIVAGQSWERTLYRKLRSCRAVVALCSEAYLKSHWCFAEIALARMENKHIFALRIEALKDNISLPSILTERQFIDLSKGREEGFRRLWLGLEEIDLFGVCREWKSNQSPYLGLNAYHEEHAPVFFGREEEIHQGIELLGRGAPNLHMVLGASGSGKSSLVRAGIVPRIRSDVSRWIVVEPFRPGRDPFSELVESFAHTFGVITHTKKSGIGTWKDILRRFKSWTAKPTRTTRDPDSVPAPEPATKPSFQDHRMQRLLMQLSELRNNPPPGSEGQVLNFLNCSYDDLQRICGREVVVQAPNATAISHSTPLIELADDLRRAAQQRDARMLLVIDQFEEMLGFEETNENIRRFLQLLRSSLEIEATPIVTIATMRSDFLEAFQRHSVLRGIDFQTLSLGPMKVEGMRRVIEEPAKLGAIELENGLADRLLKDTETPDALPLLSFTLWVMWRDFRDNGRLDISEYEQLGGLDGAIVAEADALLSMSRKADKETALRKALVRMTRLSEDGKYTRQYVDWDSADLQPVHSILEKFVERRLLIRRMEHGANTVEVAHEALFRSWLPLRTWLDNSRAEILLKQQIERDAKTWRESHRDKDNLWRGGRLEQALGVLENSELDNHGKEFVVAGKKRAQTLRRRKIGLVVLSVSIMTLLLLYFNHLREKAEDEKANAELASQEAESQRKKAVETANIAKRNEKLAVARQLATRASHATSNSFRTRLAIESLRGEYTKNTHTTLVNGMQYLPKIPLAHFSPNLKTVEIAIFSPDGSQIVIGGRGGVEIVNAQTLDVIRSMEHDENIFLLDFSSNGQYLAVGGLGKASVWRVTKNGRYQRT